MKTLIVLLMLAIAAYGDPVLPQRTPRVSPEEARTWPEWDGKPIPDGHSLYRIGGVIRVAPYPAAIVCSECETVTTPTATIRWWWAAPFVAAIPAALALRGPKAAGARVVANPTPDRPFVVPSPSPAVLPLPSPSPAAEVPEPTGVVLVVSGLAVLLKRRQ